MMTPYQSGTMLTQEGHEVKTASARLGPSLAGLHA
jgi:hypothetical protein